MHKRVLRFFFCLTVLALVFILVQIPARESKMRATIPKPVHVLSVHDHPADRLDEWMQNPLVKGTLHAIGGYPEFGQQVVKDEETRRWVNKFCNSTVLTAVAGENTPELMAVSWLGPRTWWYRLLLPRTSVKYLTEKTMVHGHPVWTLLERMPDRKHFVSFTFTKGMALGCISTNRIGVARMLDALSGREDSFDTESAAFQELTSVSTGKDDIWVPGDWFSGTPSLLSVNQFDQEAFAGDWVVPFSDLMASKKISPESIWDLSGHWPGEPLGLVTIEPGHFHHLLTHSLAEPWPALFKDWVTAAEADFGLLSVWGDELSGRISENEISFDRFGTENTCSE